MDTVEAVDTPWIAYEHYYMLVLSKEHAFACLALIDLYRIRIIWAQIHVYWVWLGISSSTSKWSVTNCNKNDRRVMIMNIITYVNW